MLSSLPFSTTLYTQDLILECANRFACLTRIVYVEAETRPIRNGLDAVLRAVSHVLFRIV